MTVEELAAKWDAYLTDRHVTLFSRAYDITKPADRRACALHMAELTAEVLAEEDA